MATTPQTARGAPATRRADRRRARSRASDRLLLAPERRLLPGRARTRGGPACGLLGFGSSSRGGPSRASAQRCSSPSRHSRPTRRGFCSRRMVRFAGAGDPGVHARARVPARARPVRNAALLRSPAALVAVGFAGAIVAVCLLSFLSRTARSGRRDRRASARPPLVSARLLELARATRRPRRRSSAATWHVHHVSTGPPGRRRRRDSAADRDALLHVLAWGELGAAAGVALYVWSGGHTDC